jgi:D-3-phosphoglycerate dehydrogenase
MNVSSQSYRVLLTDADRFPVSKADTAALDAIGADLLEVSYGISETDLAEACKEVDAVLLFSPKITSLVIANMTRCQIIARCGIGYDNIDVQAALNKGIAVTYIPDYCIEEVSDHTIAMMFDCWRKISLSNDRVKMGQWDSYQELGDMRRIAGQTLGFLGFGRIAQAISRKMQAFSLQMIAYDPYVDPAMAMRSFGVTLKSFKELLAESDVISLHVPLAKETLHIINHQAIEQMKPGVIIINTSRGRLIDEVSLALALQSGHVGAAALDVLEIEPPPMNHSFMGMKQVVITPHSAAFSEQAMNEVKQRAIEEISRKFKGLQPLITVPMERNG